MGSDEKNTYENFWLWDPALNHLSGEGVRGRPPYSMKICSFYSFYPTQFKCSAGIVFTRNVQLGRQRGSWSDWQGKKSCPGCLSETVRYRKTVLGGYSILLLLVVVVVVVVVVVIFNIFFK